MNNVVKGIFIETLIGPSKVLCVGNDKVNYISAVGCHYFPSHYFPNRIEYPRFGQIILLGCATTSEVLELLVGGTVKWKIIEICRASLPSLLPFPFPSLSSPPLPSPPLEEGGSGVLPRKILKF